MIYFPNSPALSANTVYQVQVGASCGGHGNNLEMVHSGVYTIKTQLVLTGSTVAQEMVSRLNVPLRKLTSVKVDWLFSNKNEVSPVIVKITGYSDLPKNGKVVIQLGQWSRDQQDKLMFDQVVSQVKVWPVSGVTPILDALDTQVTNGPEDSLRIEITGFQDITQGQEFVLLIDGLTNPDLDNHSPLDMMVETHWPTTGVRDSRLVRNVMTSTSIVSTEVNQNSLTVSSSVSTIQTDGGTLSINGVSGTAQLPLSGAIVFAFPPSFVVDSALATLSVSPSTVTGTLEVYRHVLVFRPSAIVPLSSLDFTLAGVRTADCQENRQLLVSVVHNQYFLSRLSHTMSYPVPSPVDLTFAIEKTSHRYSGLLANYRLIITH